MHLSSGDDEVVILFKPAKFRPVAVDQRERSQGDGLADRPFHRHEAASAGIECQRL